MQWKPRFTAQLLAAAGVGVWLLVAPAAAALPECINTAPNTTQCSTNGSTQIITSPPPNVFNNYPFLGWGGWGGWGGGLVIGIG
jgi:hypothetical protein